MKRVTLFCVVSVSFLHSRVVVVNREAVSPYSGRKAANFLALLVAVMVPVAERLELPFVKELQVSAMRHDVVDRRGRGQDAVLLASNAERVLRDLDFPDAPPSLGLVQLPVFRGELGAFVGHFTGTHDASTSEASWARCGR